MSKEQAQFECGWEPMMYCMEKDENVFIVQGARGSLQLNYEILKSRSQNVLITSPWNTVE
jgi:hypothetical protein